MTVARDPHRIVATDLAGFAECAHAATLAHEAKEAFTPRAPRRLGFDDPLVVYGEKHELAFGGGGECAVFRKPSMSLRS